MSDDQHRYVLLNPGDVVQEGDEVWGEYAPVWEEVSEGVGMMYAGEYPIRRADIPAARIRALEADAAQAADRIAALEAELARAEADKAAAVEALRRIAGEIGEFGYPFPEANEDYGPFAVVKSREALAAIRAQVAP